MRVKPVIDSTNLPRKAPINVSLILIVGCRAFQAPSWAWGAIGMLIILIWVWFIRNILLFKEKDVNIFRKNQNRQP